MTQNVQGAPVDSAILIKDTEAVEMVRPYHVLVSGMPTTKLNVQVFIWEGGGIHSPIHVRLFPFPRPIMSVPLP